MTRPFIPGTDPLAPQPMTPEEVAVLVKRARQAESTARAHGGRASKRGPLPRGRLAELHAENRARRERAKAAARALVNGGTP